MRKVRRPTAFGEEIKISLIKLNITQVELAEMLGCSKQYLQKIINGDRSGYKYIDHIRLILSNKDVA